MRRTEANRQNQPQGACNSLEDDYGNRARTITVATSLTFTVASNNSITTDIWLMTNKPNSTPLHNFEEKWMSR
jgi:hypothetical protein